MTNYQCFFCKSPLVKYIETNDLWRGIPPFHWCVNCPHENIRQVNCCQVWASPCKVQEYSSKIEWTLSFTNLKVLIRLNKSKTYFCSYKHNSVESTTHFYSLPYRLDIESMTLTQLEDKIKMIKTFQ